jgi:transposase
VMKMQPKSWVVERTFAWLGRNRTLSRDNEMLPCNSEACVYARGLWFLRKSNRGMISRCGP